MREKEWYYGALVWLIGGVGLWFLVLKNKQSLKETIFKAIILGMTSYVLFNFTNYFLIKNYSLKVAYIDTIYGMIAFGLISYIFKLYI